jgi:Fe-S-cluster containining protein
VFLTKKDLRAIAKKKNISPEQVREKFCRVVDVSGFKRLSLKEKSNLDCVFWADGICTIYSARPLQCQSFPFWGSNLESEKTWETAALTCPGIGRGSLHTRGQIDYWVRRRRNERLISLDDSTCI